MSDAELLMAVLLTVAVVLVAGIVLAALLGVICD